MSKDCINVEKFMLDEMKPLLKQHGYDSLYDVYEKYKKMEKEQ